MSHHILALVGVIVAVHVIPTLIDPLVNVAVTSPVGVIGAPLTEAHRAHS